MNISCRIINDLLPLYAEGLASEDSCHLIEEHLNSCSSCKKQYDRMNKQQKLSLPDGTVPLNKLKKHLLMKKTETILLAAALTIIFMVTVFAYLTSPDYIPYSDSVVSCTRTDGDIFIKFRNDITRYSVYYDTDDKGNKYAEIQAWNTALDNFFPYANSRTAIMASIPDSVKDIWYCSSNETDNKLIYGENNADFGGFVTLPRLVLGYYIVFAIVLSMIGGILLLLFRENDKTKGIIEKIVFVPVSYIIGHICVKGFTTKSYSAPRDFSLILLVSILVYCALLMGQSLYKRTVKAKKQNL